MPSVGQGIGTCLDCPVILKSAKAPSASADVSVKNEVVLEYCLIACSLTAQVYRRSDGVSSDAMLCSTSYVFKLLFIFIRLFLILHFGLCLHLWIRLDNRLLDTRLNLDPFHCGAIIGWGRRCPDG